MRAVENATSSLGQHLTLGGSKSGRGVFQGKREIGLAWLPLDLWRRYRIRTVTRTDLGVGSEVVECRHVETETLRLGEFAEARAETDQVVPWDVARPLHQLLTAEQERASVWTRASVLPWSCVCNIPLDSLLVTPSVTHLT